MPFIPSTIVCDQCKVPCKIAEVKLVCEKCAAVQDQAIDKLGHLFLDWPRCHDEFMSLKLASKCIQCDRLVRQHFPYGRLPLDFLPGTYQSRVFIGGNYDLMPNLRALRTAVLKLNVDYIPILPFDDFQIPPTKVYEWDLRLLHNCKFAIFDVTSPGGELFEIARCAEYKVKTLLVYQTRGAVEAPPIARTMLLQSGEHQHRGYTDIAHLQDIIDDFLLQKSRTAWQQEIEQAGSYYREVSEHVKLHANGKSVSEFSFAELKIRVPDLRISELMHGFSGSSGRIIKFQPHLPKNMSWKRNNSGSSSSTELGVVRFKSPIDSSIPPISYSFTITSQGTYILKREHLSRRNMEHMERYWPYFPKGTEFTSMGITEPMQKLEVCVEFPDGYEVNPQAYALHGTERHDDDIQIPPDKFIFKDNVARLIVNRPRLNYTYGIIWNIP